MADGTLSTLAFSERGSRSHFWAPVESDRRRRRSTAQKSLVTSAGHADSYVVSTRPAGTRVADRVHACTWWRPARPGIETAGPWVGLGLRGNASSPMIVRASLVDATMLLGEDGKGLDLMLGVVLPWFQLGQGGVSLGHRRRARWARR